MNREQISEEIFDLLTKESWSDLSDSDRRLVEQVMTSEDYRAHRAIILDFQAVDRNMHSAVTDPSPPTLSRIQRVLDFKIHLYKVAIVFLLLGGISFFIWQNSFRHVNTGSTHLLVNDKTDGKGQSIREDVYPEELVFSL